MGIIRFGYMRVKGDSDMNTVQLNGGLGNQMFQYSAGRAVSLQHNVSLALDVTYCKRNPARPYTLCNFKVKAEAVEESPFIIKLKSILQPQSIYKEQAFYYDPSILNCHDDVYLQGYWQTEKYFKSIEKIIREDFTLSEEPDYLNQQMAETIGKCDSISLHIRRGDYISNPDTNAYHGICSEEYYREAISKIDSTIKDPRFFVFSDDPKWAKENFDTGYVTSFVDFNGPDKDYEDLRLMSLCQHHIIANSSFSWWGAWLCQNTEKIVIAPKKWFNKPDINTHDLIPDTWIRI